jgi:flagellar biosynthetic protein FliR
VLAALSSSFTVIPPGTGAWTAAAQDSINRGVAEAWTVAMVLSFPVLTAVMLLTMVEGVLARTVPQINLMQVSFGVKIVVSIAVLYAALPAAVAFIGLLIARLEPAVMQLMLALR